MRLHASNGVHQIGDGVGFAANGVAYDLDTIAVKFSPPVAGTFVTSLGGGGVALTDGITLTELDDTGAVVREAPMPVIPAPSAARMMLFEGAETTPSYGGGDLWIAVVAERLERYEGTGLAANTDEYPDRNGTRQPEKKLYPMPERAVVEFFRKSFGGSQRAQVEYGGKVCKTSHEPYQYATSAPVEGPPCLSDPPPGVPACWVALHRANCTIGTRAVSTYHTHPFRYLGPENQHQDWSDGDYWMLVNDANLHGWRHDDYVGTFCGEVWRGWLAEYPPRILGAGLGQPVSASEQRRDIPDRPARNEARLQ